MPLEKMLFPLDEELRIVVYRELSGRDDSGTGSIDTGKVKGDRGAGKKIWRISR
jgi:hypothetical protein